MCAARFTGRMGNGPRTLSSTFACMCVSTVTGAPPPPRPRSLQVERIIRSAIPGVRKVLIYDHALRSGGQTLRQDKQAGAIPGACLASNACHPLTESRWSRAPRRRGCRVAGAAAALRPSHHPQVNPYASLVHSDATVRSGHTRAKDQVSGSTASVWRALASPCAAQMVM